MFKSARLKLTGWYLLMIMLLSLAFSGAIYKTQSDELERFGRFQRVRAERRILGKDQIASPIVRLRNLPPADPELVEEARHRLLISLLLINGGILILSGGVGYFLAGRTLAPISAMLEEQRRFVGDASHELKTPLTSLKSTLEVNLRDKKLTLQEAKETMTDSLGEVNRMQSLAENLLMLAQYQHTNSSMVKEKVPLGEVVGKAIVRVQPLAKAKSQKISRNIGEENIWGNEKALVDLVVILLDNAVKYSPAKKEINIRLEKTDGHIQLLVKDNGTGIKENDRPHIFDRFYRGDMARGREGSGGYGLGLAIAKRIAEEHGGTIKVESETGKGSTFILILPKGTFS